MAGVEAVVASAGKAVAERAVREWLAVRAGRTERESDLTELVQVTFRDRMLRRKFDNQVQGIALAVEDRLRPLIEQEYRGLDEGTRAAVLAEVTDALRAADLSDAALLAADGDAVRLAERVAETLPAPNLGEAEDRLFAVLLVESLECVVRMVQQLPQYLPRVATESLGRLGGLAEQMERLLARMPARSLDAPEGRQDDAAFERRYLDHVSRVLDEVELFGVRVETYRPRTSLSVAYISLSVSSGDPVRRAPLDRMPIASLRENGEREPGNVRIEEALRRSRLTLLRGEAGSGKSTLLRWLAVTAARGGFTGDLGEWNGCVPFMIKLRSHAGGRFPAPESFLDDVAREVAGRMPRGWVQRVLELGRGLLLVDGVDELVLKHRPAVRQWLGGLLAAYPGLRIVVTSRPAAAESRWLADDGFSSALLEPMTPEDLRELIRQWHIAIRDSPSLPCAPDELEAHEGRLLSRLESNPHLRLLAATPLLAAMLCALNLDRRGQLPHRRMALYEAVLAMLLERRDAERGIDDVVSLDQGQKEWVLRQLAWRLVSMGRSELSKATALKLVGQKLAAMTRMPYSAHEVLDHLLRRSGVIREPVPGRIDFVHKTVQEYLAAKQVVEDEDIEAVVEKAHLDQWREVVIMTAGHATGRLRRDLLAGLLDRPDAEPGHTRRLRLVVTGCLETIQEYPMDLRERIDACVAAVIPPKSEEEAALLAVVGEEVLRRLPDDLSGLSAKKAALVVRTAWLINGEGGMEKLAGYATDGRVQEELVAGWDYFDSAAYAKRVLVKAPLKERFIVREQRHCRNLRHLRHLTTVNVRECADLGFLAELPWLRALGLYGLRTEDIGPIGGLRELERLSIGYLESPAIDIAPLASLARLRQLDALYFKIRDLTALDRLPRLELLGLSLRHGQDIGPLARQVELQTLILDGGHTRVDVSALAGMTRLEELNLMDAEIEDFAAIAEVCPSVDDLVLTRLNGVNLAALAGLGLGYLSISHCEGVEDIEALRSQSRLRLLDLDQPGVRDLSPLAELPMLSHLRLREVADNIDLAPLAGMLDLHVELRRGQRVVNAHLLGGRVRTERL
ncbi:ATP-binding protein [Spongiactinospora rosea]|uniref:ATP-binding protein n=1 Tax=Spongiactinospora rosea TaxID=2248750 RepID=A0A366LNQ0_9ACTN|nr:NACHT domain-containing protein [Spongiactinospora rosea]RBQ15546.1 ATP-binding protein [Spongiactinospora rosea]